MPKSSAESDRGFVATMFALQVIVFVVALGFGFGFAFAFGVVVVVFVVVVGVVDVDVVVVVAAACVRPVATPSAARTPAHPASAPRVF